ncbi:hypothetical protein AMS68_003842 [Peltaster fructicola]|uniref:Pre-mRNA-splicing factor SLU7 n=1 Tax=Peltaster fructicola TaxID=286661 RepID=A0A6H0XUJ7_9PEZI|nr:hypothetical protein AMS68_003842 [Peltaster fructicola]
MAPPKKPVEASQNNERNEYIPSFIAKKPFYIDDSTTQDDYLEHQRLQAEKNHDPLATSKWYDRGVQGPAATKYRKGACENCGAMTHKAKDCLQRKRKHGAKWTGKNIAADEKVQDIKLGWDAKRDRWNGYDAAQYEEVVEEFQRKEKPDEDARYEEETDMGRQQSTATRNLRLREDTAKYLMNLDVDSAKYDPKTRTIENAVADDAEAEDGFQRATGDAAAFENAQKYAWETQERGDVDKLHLQANPTAGELTRKRKAQEDVQNKEAKRKALLEQYGSQDEVKKSVVTQSNERYVEYDDRGKIKGEPERKEKSMYPEDVLINNHTSVWGSWWKDFQWGYACCHSTVKNSFCTGREGMKAIEEAEAFARGDVLENDKQKELRLMEEDRLEERQLVKPSKDESLRRLDELSQDVTEDQMEEYRRNRSAKNDPMAGMLGQDGLLEQGG